MLELLWVDRHYLIHTNKPIPEAYVKVQRTTGGARAIAIPFALDNFQAPLALVDLPLKIEELQAMVRSYASKSGSPSMPRTCLWSRGVSQIEMEWCSATVSIFSMISVAASLQKEA
jgi:hypothetical protein